jgi:hypothetical protein
LAILQCNQEYQIADIILKWKRRFGFKIYDLDSLIPPQQMDNLYKQATGAISKSMHEIKEGQHNSSWANDIKEYGYMKPLTEEGSIYPYYQAVREFVISNS